MPFGQFKGEKLIDIPAWYMLKLIENNKCYGDLKKYLKDNEDVFIKEKEDESKHRK